MTTPMEQTLDGCWLAVSKSIAMKSRIMRWNKKVQSVPTGSGEVHTWTSYAESYAAIPSYQVKLTTRNSQPMSGISGLHPPARPKGQTSREGILQNIWSFVSSVSFWCYLSVQIFPELYGIVVVTQFLDDEDELFLDVFLGCSLLTGKPLIFTKTKSFINDWPSFDKPTFRRLTTDRWCRNRWSRALGCCAA